VHLSVFSSSFCSVFLKFLKFFNIILFCTGIGAGYDGINVTPSGLNDVSRYPYLFAELLSDPAWTENDILALAGLNFLRVFQKVEEVRDAWKKMDLPPLEELGPRKPVEECVSKKS